jgi:hypothetical protein
MQAVTFIFAFVAVLALIVLAAWLVRRFANNRLGANPNRGRMPRLAVIDAAAVDGRRRLVLVRRDNVEHLLMIGGPTDIVVEPNIVRAQARSDQMPQRPPGGAEPPRIAPLPDAASWTNGDGTDHHPESQVPEPPRPARPAFAEELRRPPVLAERRAERERAERSERSDPLAGFSAEAMGLRPEPRPESRSESRPESRPEPRPDPKPEPRLEPIPPMPPRMPRGEPLMPRAVRPAAEPKVPPLRAERPTPPPPPPPVPPPVPAPAQTADQNLAEMAQRLEAALRRPTASADAPPVAPEPPAAPPVRAARNEPPTAPPPSPKSSFENLEEEMASLLGRPKSSSSS